MKKLFFIISAICLSMNMLAQDASSSTSNSRKVRVGILVRGTPSWYNTDKSNYYKSAGAVFGYGFGLSLEFKLNEVLAFKTGVGGDFDGGKINYTYSVSNNGNNINDIYTAYLMNKTPQIIEIKGTKPNQLTTVNSTNYLKSRHISTSYVTIPVILKMMTKEIGGFKYYVDFGANIGVLVGAKTTDDVLQSTVSSSALSSVKNSGLNVYNECIPIRAGLNVGLGAEYRLAGTTSLFFGASFVNSFIPVLKSNSVNNYNNIDGNGNFIVAKQSAKPMGIQINIGVMF